MFVREVCLALAGWAAIFPTAFRQGPSTLPAHTPAIARITKHAMIRFELADAGSAFRSSTGGDYHYRIRHLPLEYARTEAL
jgi:hypothetical protein